MSELSPESMVMKVWIDGSVADPTIRVFGLNLIERHLLAMTRAIKMGASFSEVCIDMGTSTWQPKVPPKANKALQVSITHEVGAAGERLAQFLVQAAGVPVLVLSGDTLIDARLYSDLRTREGSWGVIDDKEGQGAAVLRLDSVDHAIVSIQAKSVAEIARGALQQGASILRQESFNGFIRNLRRTLPFYLYVVPDQNQVKKLERFLFWSNYKGSTDVFTRYVYPPLVWIMVRPLAAHRMHPNLVTIVSILMTFLAIPFFANGYYFIGLLLAYGMSVLDSVDGKLARLTFTDSWIGNILDHGLDLIHPPMWYIAWAYGIAGDDPNHAALQLAIVSTVVYVLDRVVLKVYPKIFQRGLHTHSKMDGFVRSFISRRNINLPIFTLGVILDSLFGGASYAAAAFYFIVFWQVMTLAYHAGRTFWILFIEKAQNDPTRVSAT